VSHTFYFVTNAFSADFMSSEIPDVYNKVVPACLLERMSFCADFTVSSVLISNRALLIGFLNDVCGQVLNCGKMLGVGVFGFRVQSGCDVNKCFQ